MNSWEWKAETKEPSQFERAVHFSVVLVKMSKFFQSKTLTNKAN